MTQKWPVGTQRSTTGGPKVARYQTGGLILVIPCAIARSVVRPSAITCCGRTHVRHVLSYIFGHENISMAIPSLPLIQEEQFLVIREKIYTKYW